MKADVLRDWISFALGETANTLFARFISSEYGVKEGRKKFKEVEQQTDS